MTNKSNPSRRRFNIPNDIRAELEARSLAQNLSQPDVIRSLLAERNSTEQAAQKIPVLMAQTEIISRRLQELGEKVDQLSAQVSGVCSAARRATNKSQDGSVNTSKLDPYFLSAVGMVVFVFGFFMITFYAGLWIPTTGTVLQKVAG